MSFSWSRALACVAGQAALQAPGSVDRMLTIAAFVVRRLPLTLSSSSAESSAEKMLIKVLTLLVLEILLMCW